MILTSDEFMINAEIQNYRKQVFFCYNPIWEGPNDLKLAADVVQFQILLTKSFC